jgi:spore germination protein KB
MRKLEKGCFNGWQLVMIITGFCFGEAIVLAPARAAGIDAWLAILAGLLEGSLFILVFLLLSKRFPGMTLVEISEAVYGRFLGKLISVSYLWFFFHLSSLVMVVFSNFYTTTILNNTPALVILIATTILVVVAVRNGIEVIARCSEILTPIIIFFAIIDTIMLLKNIDFKNIQPILATPLNQFLWGTHNAAMFPFGEMVVLLMFLPFGDDSRRVGFLVFAGAVGAGVFLAILSFRNIGVLGGTAQIYTFPSFEAFKMINIGQILSRLEIIIAVNLLTMGFLKIAVLLYGTVLGTAQLFRCRVYQPLVLPFGVLMLLLSMLNFYNITETTEFAEKIWPIYAFPFEVGFPVLTLLIAMIKGGLRRLSDQTSARTGGN